MRLGQEIELIKIIKQNPWLVDYRPFSQTHYELTYLSQILSSHKTTLLKGKSVLMSKITNPFTAATLIYRLPHKNHDKIKKV